MRMMAKWRGGFLFCGVSMSLSTCQLTGPIFGLTPVFLSILYHYHFAFQHLPSWGLSSISPSLKEQRQKWLHACLHPLPLNICYTRGHQRGMDPLQPGLHTPSLLGFSGLCPNQARWLSDPANCHTVGAHEWPFVGRCLGFKAVAGSDLRPRKMSLIPLEPSDHGLSIFIPSFPPSSYIQSL